MEADINYFEGIPDNILVTSILPKLPLNNLLELCESNQYFNKLCQNELLWKHRMMIKFPQLVKSKSNNISWKHFYLYHETSIMVPVYYHGDIVSEIPISEHYLNNILPYILFYLSDYIQNNQSIGFIKNLRDYNTLELLFTIESPYLTIKTIQEFNINDIDKIILIDNPIFNANIWDELTSPLGTPPIYGYYESETYIFIIIDKRNLFGGIATSRGRACVGMNINDIISILKLLGHDNINTLLPIGLLTRKERECLLLKESLEEIGHFI